jgi:hypothetical protein
VRKARETSVVPGAMLDEQQINDTRMAIAAQLTGQLRQHIVKLLGFTVSAGGFSTEGMHIVLPPTRTNPPFTDHYVNLQDC